MQFDIDCAIDIMNFIIDNQKLSDDKKLDVFIVSTFMKIRSFKNMERT